MRNPAIHVRVSRACRAASALCSVLTLVCMAPPAAAHDIPGKATVLLYVKAEAERTLVLARLPMEAVTELQLPIRGPGFLDMTRAEPALLDAAELYFLYELRLLADGTALDRIGPVKTRVALPSDKSFADWPSALATINSAPLDSSSELYWKQAWLDVLVSFPPVGNKKISIDPGLRRLAVQVHTVLHYLPLNGEQRTFSYTGLPGLVVLEPSWWYSVGQFIGMGFNHILSGIDHLLFLICLALPAQRIRSLVAAVTAFTVAHSITLLASALGMVATSQWFAPLIETLIAMSVLYMACENILGARPQLRWMAVFAFGLIHGFGFSFILSERMQFAGAHLVSALLAFNVGVELGQLLVLALAVPLLRWLFARIQQQRIAIIALSALVAHTAWHWLTDRGAQLLQYPFAWPTVDAAFLAATMRWIILLLLCGAAMWALQEAIVRLRQRAGWMD
jgi:hypothetical protein